LDEFGARYYSSSLGRFVTPDEFWKDGHRNDPQSWNEYVYVRNNPLQFSDPSGEGAMNASCYANGKDCVSATPDNTGKDKEDKDAGGTINIVKNSGKVGRVLNWVADGDTVAQAAQNAAESETWEGKAGGYAALGLIVAINVIPGGGEEAKGIEKGAITVYEIVKNGKTLYV